GPAFGAQPGRGPVARERYARRPVPGTLLREEGRDAPSPGARGPRVSDTGGGGVEPLPGPLGGDRPGGVARAATVLLPGFRTDPEVPVRVCAGRARTRGTRRGSGGPCPARPGSSCHRP